MSSPPSAHRPALPRRVVVGTYSLRADGDGPEAGTGLRVLDLARDGSSAPFLDVGHATLPSPTWVVPHPRAPWLVSVSETDPSAVACTRLEADGSLTVLDRRGTGGASACHLAVTPDGRWVVVAHYGSGTVETFGLDDEGHLDGPVSRVDLAGPLGPDRERQDRPHAHQVVPDPARPGELLVCDLGTDRVHRMHLDDHGRLSEPVDPVLLPAGSGPRHLALAGDTLLVGCELSDELWVARREGEGWRHTQTVPASTRTRTQGDRPDAPVAVSEVQVAGDHVVVATRGVDTLTTFALDRSSSTVERVAEVSCQGRHPRDLLVADGLAWVADQESDEVVALDLAAVVAGREDDPVCRIAVPRPARVVLPDPRPSSQEPRSRGANLPAVDDDLTTGGRVLPITRWGTPVMHAKTRPVEQFDDELRSLVRDMFATMEAASGVGLAANQVGRDLALFVYDCPDKDEVRRVGVVCNPVVELPEGRDRNLDAADEGCLSYPGAYEELARPDHAVCRGQDVDGSPVEIHGDGLLARCLQHETDHLNGIVFGDRLSGRARKKLRQQHDDLAARYPDDWPVSPRRGPAPEAEQDDESEL